MKRPAFQFYPGDWQANSNLRRCSFAEKGAWISVMCLMHDAPEYGLLRWSLKEIAQAIGAPMSLLRGLLAKGVLKGDDKEVSEPCIYTPRSGRKDGDPVTLVAAQSGPLWYSSRMVSDEYVRVHSGGNTRFVSTRESAPQPPPNPSPSRRHGEDQGEQQSDSPSQRQGDWQGAAPCRRQRDGASSSSSINIVKDSYGGKVVAHASRSPLPTDPDPPKPKKPEKTGTGTRLPDDWTLPDDWRQWAQGERPDLDADRTAACFADYWRGKAGASARKTDWLATWRNWVRNERAPPPQTGNVRRLSRQESIEINTQQAIGAWLQQPEVIDV